MLWGETGTLVNHFSLPVYLAWLRLLVHFLERYVFAYYIESSTTGLNQLTLKWIPRTLLISANLILSSLDDYVDQSGPVWESRSSYPITCMMVYLIVPP